MRVLSGEEVQDLLPMQPLIAQLRVAFLNPCVCPARQVVSLPGGSGDRQLLYMPAFDPAGAAVVKFATVLPENPARGLPAIQAAILVLSSSGTPVAVLDGADSHISSQSGAHAESSVFDIEGMCPVQDNPSLVQTFYGLGVRWMLIAYNHSNSDELIRACARKGGVVGLSGIGPYLGTSTRLRERFLDQLRYVIDLVGTPHVGLCLDYVFDCAELNEFIRHNPTLFSADMDTAAGMPMIEPEAIGEIVEGLLRDNLTDEQIREVLGLNWLRVARQVWK